MRISKIIFFALFFFSLLSSCASGNSSQSSSEGIITYANNLLIDELDDYTYVQIRNPWDTTATLASYCLIDKSQEKLPENLPEGATIIKVPLEKSVIYSSVHASLIEELGCAYAVTGLCDTQFIIDETLKAQLASGKIEDCGNSMQPNIEKIIKTGAEAVWLSPYESDNGSHGKLSLIGIPVIEGADYMENTPLGRAEWMKFYGRLYGKGIQADSLFKVTEQEYLSLKDKTKDMNTRPTVLFDRLYSGVWNVPTSGSVTGIMIEDAGGTNPFAEYSDAGSAALALETVLYKAGNADFWFIRYYDSTLTMAQLSTDNEAYSRFKAYKTGGVYGTNSIESGVFDDAAFHPQMILADLVSILHPELGISPKKRYYSKLQ